MHPLILREACADTNLTPFYYVGICVVQREFQNFAITYFIMEEQEKLPDDFKSGY